jgi:translation initiation factor 2 subunit 2
MDFSNYDKLLDRAYEQLPEEKDKASRFDMPQPEVFFEGNKTILKNFIPISKELRRDETHLQKFLTKDLGAYSLVSGDRLVFNKKLFGKKIGDGIKKYIAEYVLCPQCGKPDTKFSSMEGVKILKCEACGAWKPLKSI